MYQPYCAAPTNELASGTISVLIPSYGHARYIQQTLESLLQQTRPPLEIIVVNDGSPDDTASAVQSYLDRITYVEQSNQGLVKTLNRGIALCRGDYILVIASDDWLAPNALELLGVALDKYPDVGLVHSAITVVDMDGQTYPNAKVATSLSGKHREVAKLITANYISAPTALVRKTALVEAGPFENFTYSQDWAMWLAIVLRGWGMYGVAEPVAFYRRHPNNLTRPETQLHALEDNLAMLTSTQQRFCEQLLPEHKRAFAAGRQRILRVLAWYCLENGMREASRSWFQALSKEHIDANLILGYALAILPSFLYHSMRRVRKNVNLLPQSR